MPPLDVEMLQGKLPSVELAAAGLDECCALVRRSRAELLSLVERHGGVLVHCEALAGPREFEQCITELIDISRKYPGGAPRKLVTEGGVFTTTEFEPNLPIPGHCELGYMPRVRPELIAFFCEQAPPSGGMTPVLDMAEVLRALPEDVVAKFSVGIQTSVNWGPGGGNIFDHVRMRFKPQERPWTELGATPEAAEAEWRRRNADEASICWSGSWMQPFIDMPAVLEHNSVKVWSGFFPFFHWSGAAFQALFDLALHNRSWLQLRASATMIVSAFWHTFANIVGGLPVVGKWTWVAQAANPGLLSCRLKTGAAISSWDVLRILWTYNSHLIKWQWRPGQFVLLDNSRMGHARTPYDPAPRSIYTAFGRMKRAGAPATA